MKFEALLKYILNWISLFWTYLHGFLIFWMFFSNLGTNTFQTHRLLHLFGGLRSFHSSFLINRAREELFSIVNNISKLAMTSKKRE